MPSKRCGGGPKPLGVEHARARSCSTALFFESQMASEGLLVSTAVTRPPPETAKRGAVFVKTMPFGAVENNVCHASRSSLSHVRADSGGRKKVCWREDQLKSSRISWEPSS